MSVEQDSPDPRTEAGESQDESLLTPESESESEIDTRLRILDSEGLTPSRAIGSGSRPSAYWEPPPIQVLQVLLPQYEFLVLVGRGGMGAVYRAVQRSLGRSVAIKVLPADVMDDADADFVQRFRNEARTMGRMNHPGIVNVYDFGEATDDEGRVLLYFVMEYVEGTDVAQLVKTQGKLPSEHALAIAAHVCDALTYAHGQGVIHRDIKPANVLINAQGQVKVADFGLAKATDAEGKAALTRTNMAMGTPDYVAPEALMLGVNADHRADLYAVGVMLYNMLTGEIPRGMFKLPSQKVGTDPRFDGIIRKAMESDREERFQTAGEIRQALDAILTTPLLKAGDHPEASSAAIPKALVMQEETWESTPSKHRKDAAGPPGSPKAKGFGTSWWMVGGLGIVGVSIALGWLGKRSSSQTVGGAIAAIPVAVDLRKGTESENAPTSNNKVEAPASVSSPAPVSAAVENKVSAPAGTPAPVLTNSLGMKFVQVPGTKVLMCIHETRRLDYEAFEREVPGVDETWKQPTIFGKALPNYENHPVCMVDWEDATAFCKWLSRKEGQNRRYRLPSEREWRLAVAQEVKNPETISNTQLAELLKNQYPWGKNPPEQSGNYRDTKDGFDTTAPVMSFLPNHLGIYDLGGNVWEWCGNTEKGDVTMHGCGFMNFSVYRRSETKQKGGVGFRRPPDNDVTGRVVGFRVVLEISDSNDGSSSNSSTSKAQVASKPAPVSYPAGQWVKLFSSAEDLSGSVEWNQGWIKSSGSGLLRPPHFPESLNQGIRFTLRTDAKAGLNFGSIRLRDRLNSQGNFHYYGMSGTESGGELRLFLERWSGGVPKMEFLTSWKAVPLWRKTESNHIELFAIGQRLLAKVNGEWAAEATLEDQIRGGPTLCRMIGEIRDVEVICLDGMPEPDVLKLIGAQDVTTVSKSENTKNAPPQVEASPEVLQRLKGLEEAFAAAFQRDFSVAPEAGWKDLSQKYLKGLEGVAEFARRSGNLDELVALKEEIQLIEKQADLPESDPQETPESLKKLRAVMRSEMTERRKLYGKYQETLESYITELTQAGKLSDALAVKQKLETIVEKSRLFGK